MDTVFYILAILLMLANTYIAHRNRRDAVTPLLGVCSAYYAICLSLGQSPALALAGLVAYTILILVSHHRFVEFRYRLQYQGVLAPC